VNRRKEKKEEERGIYIRKLEIDFQIIVVFKGFQKSKQTRDSKRGVKSKKESNNINERKCRDEINNEPRSEVMVRNGVQIRFQNRFLLLSRGSSNKEFSIYKQKKKKKGTLVMAIRKLRNTSNERTKSDKNEKNSSCSEENARR
jgi:hypothetical protein